MFSILANAGVSTFHPGLPNTTHKRPPPPRKNGMEDDGPGKSRRVLPFVGKIGKEMKKTAKER